MVKPSKKTFSRAGLNNKKLVTILNNKMFKGYIQIKNSKTFKPSTDSNDIPTLQWKKQTFLPFNEKYNLNYKQKHFASNQVSNMNELFNIRSINKSVNKPRNSKDIFLTSKNNTNKGPTRLSLSSSVNKSITITDNNSNTNNAYLLSKLFPYDSELDKISSLHFLSLEKHPYESNSILQTISKTEQLEKDRFNEIEFLYRISHPLKAPKTQINFHSKRFLVSRNNRRRSSINDGTQDRDKLRLNITGLADKKPKLLSPEERRMNYIHNNLEAIRALPKDTFKDCLDNLFGDNDINKDDNNKQSNVKEIQFIPDELKQRERERRRYNYIKTQPQVVKYKVFQNTLNQREEKYHEIRKMAFEVKDTKKSKGNHDNQKCKNDYHYIMHNTQIVLINNINPKSHLLTETQFTFKTFCDKQAKQRDTKMAWGLRKEFTPNDIRRLLNGKELLDIKIE